MGSAWSYTVNAETVRQFFGDDNPDGDYPIIEEPLEDEAYYTTDGQHPNGKLLKYTNPYENNVKRLEYENVSLSKKLEHFRNINTVGRKEFRKMHCYYENRIQQLEKALAAKNDECQAHSTARECLQRELLSLRRAEDGKSRRKQCKSTETDELPTAVCYARTMTLKPPGSGVGTQTDRTVRKTVAVQTGTLTGPDVDRTTADSCARKTVATQTDASACRATGAVVAVQTKPIAGHAGRAGNPTTVTIDLTVMMPPESGAAVVCQNCADRSVGVVGTAFGEAGDASANVIEPASVEPPKVDVPTANGDEPSDDRKLLELRSDDNYSDDAKIVRDFLEKFGCDRDVKHYRFYLKGLLIKIDAGGFKALRFEELAYVHQHVIENSVKQLKKYTNVLELAANNFPTLNKSTFKDKYEMVHLLVVLDRVMQAKNKEIVKQKNKYNAEIGALRDKYTAEIDELRNKLSLTERPATAEKLSFAEKFLFEKQNDESQWEFLKHIKYRRPVTPESQLHYLNRLERDKICPGLDIWTGIPIESIVEETA